MISLEVGYDAGKKIHGRKRQLKRGAVGACFAGLGNISQCSRT